MYIYYGEKYDKSDKKSDSFLEVNSCGIHAIGIEQTVMRKKGRKDYHIVLVGKGKMKVKINGEIREIYRGGLFVFYPHEEQYYIYEKDTVSYWMHISGTGVCGLLEATGISSGAYNCSFDASVFETFSKAAGYFALPEKRQYLSAAVLRLFSLISDGIRSAKNDTANTIWSAATYIDMNFNKDLSIDRLAKISGYSKSRFAHVFKETVGTSPMEYQKNIRLTNACRLLNTTELKINEIAHTCGYDDALYFCRAFKRKFALSPSRYRAENTENTQI